MKDLIRTSHRHLLWKDEIGDTFLLTDFAEIYKYSETVLQLLFFKKSPTVQFKHLFYDERQTDEPLWHFKTNVENLPAILAVCKFKKRPYLNGKWIKNLEIRLGHKIIPYRPELE